MNPKLQAKWDEAFARPGEKVLVGRDVVCDVCSEDWTDELESGGFLFGSYGYCPDCAPRGLETIKKYNEERYIRARCEEGESFADFIRRMRGPDAYIRVSQ